MSQDNKLIQLQLLRNIYGRTTPSKIELENAKVYIHKKDKESGSQNIHIDVEHEDLNEIIKSGENSFVGGKNGGVFIGLKDEMIERAENFVGENK